MEKQELEAAIRILEMLEEEAINVAQEDNRPREAIPAWDLVRGYGLVKEDVEAYLEGLTEEEEPEDQDCWWEQQPPPRVEDDSR